MTNQELDIFIAEKVMGWTEIKEEKMPFGKKAPIGKMPNYPTAKARYWLPKYTESISDAFQVVDKVMEKFPDWFFTLDVFGKNYGDKREVVATFQESAEGYIIYACEGAKTKELAICLAAKKAIEA